MGRADRLTLGLLGVGLVVAGVLGAGLVDCSRYALHATGIPDAESGANLVTYSALDGEQRETFERAVARGSEPISAAERERWSETVEGGYTDVVYRGDYYDVFVTTRNCTSSTGIEALGFGISVVGLGLLGKVTYSYARR